MRINTLVWLCTMISFLLNWFDDKAARRRSLTGKGRDPRVVLGDGAPRSMYHLPHDSVQSLAIVHRCSKIVSRCSMTLTRMLAPEWLNWGPSARVGVLQVDGRTGTDSREKRRRGTESEATDTDRRGRRRWRTTDSEPTEPEKKMLYHSNRRKCLKKGSGQLCQYRGTVSQNVCGSGNAHIRITWGIIKNSDSRASATPGLEHLVLQAGTNN